MRSRRSSFSVLILASLVFCCAGCKVHFIAPYDENTDSAMTKVQNDTELFFNKLQDAGKTEAGSYDTTKSYYETAEATLHTLLTRAQATPKMEQVATQIASIDDAIERIQKSHQRDTYISADQITIERGLLESQFRSFFTLELALKNSPSNTSAKTSTPAPAKTP